MLFQNGYNYNIVEILDPDLDKARAEFVNIEIAQWRASTKYLTMIDSHSYYQNGNDINGRVRTIAGAETTKLANNKIAHPFLHKLTEQKVSYLLSEKPSVKVDDEDAVYQELLEDFINERFCQRLQDCGRYAVLNGLSWIQVFYDETGNLDTKRIPSEQIIPYWNDTEHTKLDALIRFYELFNSSTQKITLKAELWLTTGEREQGGVYFYEIVDGVVNIDTTRGKNGYMAHYTLNGTDYIWDRIPFVPFKYNSFELPLLNLIKSMNDAYDNTVSDMVNDLEDVPNRIIKIKNCGGTEAKDLREGLKNNHMIAISGDADIDTIDMEINGTIAENTLNRLQKDIYSFGSGVDQEVARIGNQSGVALKFLYAGLDLDCKTMGQNFRASLEWLLWFYTNHLANIKKGDFTDKNVKITFNTNMIVNQSEIIKDVSLSTGLLSEKTLLENHPFVTDVLTELKELAKSKPQPPEPSNGNNVDLKL